MGEDTVYGVFVGTLISASLNKLAIRMLFRPYKPIYSFGEQLSLTPGLIPKRLDELAKQLGKLLMMPLYRI